jgi:hypothetical protein
MEIRTPSTSPTHPLLPELTVEGQNQFLQFDLMFAREAPLNGSIAARGGTYTHIELVLRLVDKNGATIWAYDGTKKCNGSATKCAVTELLEETKKKAK